jgi:hypothetical protein
MTKYRPGVEPEQSKLTAIVRRRRVSARQHLELSEAIVRHKCLDFHLAHGSAFIINDVAQQDACRVRNILC